MSSKLDLAKAAIAEGAKFGTVYPLLAPPERSSDPASTEQAELDESPEQAELRAWYAARPELPVTVTPRGQWNGDEYGVPKPPIDPPMSGTYLNGKAADVSLRPTPPMTSTSDNDGASRGETPAPRPLDDPDVGRRFLEAQPEAAPSSPPGSVAGATEEVRLGRGAGGKPRRPPQPTAMQAKAMGYLGDPCGQCGGMKVRANGACTICDECGKQGGCG